MSAAKKKVLITGGAGLIGSILLERLKAHYELASFDLREAPGVQSYTGNLTDF